MNKSIDRIVGELKHWYSISDHTQEQIARYTGIDQSQVSKILSGRFRRVSPNVIKICEYANIQVLHEGERVLSERLKVAVLELWDGTSSSEKDLLQVLRALSFIARRKRCDSSQTR